jgi:hypothetical protein
MMSVARVRVVMDFIVDVMKCESALWSGEVGI